MKNIFNILIANTNRSIVYLKILKKNKILPNKIIYLDDKIKSTTSIKIKNILKNKLYSTKIFKTNDINNKSVTNYLINTDSSYIIYSGPSGQIIKNKKLLLKKKIIHSHTGRLPQYKGSTAIFYSMLKEKKIYCSTIILNEKIDEGKILMVKKYPIPKKIWHIDCKYDNEIRAKNILSILKKKIPLAKKQRYMKNNKFLPYFIMHPVLRFITLYRK